MAIKYYWKTKAAVQAGSNDQYNICKAAKTAVTKTLEALQTEKTQGVLRLYYRMKGKCSHAPQQALSIEHIMRAC